MSAGAFRERIALLSPPATVPDGRGGNVASGLPPETVLYARVTPLNAYEKAALGQVLNPAAYRITLRYRAGVSAKDRIRWNGLVLNVQGCQADERKQHLTLTCFNSGK